MSEIICCSGAARFSLIFSWVMPAVGKGALSQHSQAENPMGRGGGEDWGSMTPVPEGLPVNGVDRYAQRSFLPGPVNTNTTCWATNKVHSCLVPSRHCSNIDYCYTHSSSTPTIHLPVSNCSNTWLHLILSVQPGPPPQLASSDRSI